MTVEDIPPSQTKAADLSDRTLPGRTKIVLGQTPQPATSVKKAIIRRQDTGS
jgi:hypothetical protein